MPELNLSGPRYKYPVSTAELDRRLVAVQAELKRPIWIVALPRLKVPSLTVSFAI